MNDKKVPMSTEEFMQVVGMDPGSDSQLEMLELAQRANQEGRLLTVGGPLRTCSLVVIDDPMPLLSAEDRKSRLAALRAFIASRLPTQGESGPEPPFHPGVDLATIHLKPRE